MVLTLELDLFAFLATYREAARGMLPYQKSTIGRQPSMARPGMGNGSSSRRLGGANPAMARQVSAARQASHLRAYSAARQASTIGRGFGRNPSVLRVRVRRRFCYGMCCCYPVLCLMDSLRRLHDKPLSSLFKLSM